MAAELEARGPTASIHLGASQTERPSMAAQANGIADGTTPDLQVLCGPLLNYRRMSGQQTESPVWHGSVLIVTAPRQVPGQLRLRCLGAVGDDGNTLANGHLPPSERGFDGVRLFEDPRKAFWRFEMDVPFQEHECTWEYTIPHMRPTAGDKSRLDQPKRFAVPSRHESMRIMFHSCNGFSVGTNEEAWSGPALWNDVLRVHQQQPFHVMIGGGDQIYNDGVRVDGPLREWTDMGNPKKRRDYQFNEDLRARCDDYYFNNYVRWYTTEPFASANGQIPQLNIWDDHDIIDGFGSYTDHFMQCPVFRGIGGVAHKYYLLFQHHIPPPPSTYTTDAPQTTHVTGITTAVDEVQVRDTYVMTNAREDPSFIIGSKAGPYVEERSRSVYCQLGKSIAFVGIDARTERTRHQINYPETYDQIFHRTSQEIGAAKGTIKHLMLLLGVPIAYPRLQWLENILQSPIIGPIKFLNKRFGVAGSFFNHFDGNVDLLDDLDDHYTAHQHKKERKMLVQRLQDLAKQHSIRITILSGDVHLAALGRFYSNPKLGIAVENDWRYMANVVSSAITNKPPPVAVANLLARRNKVHHLDHETDETLLALFDKDPGVGQPGFRPKTAAANHATMPSRNYAIICESHQHIGDVGATAGNATAMNGNGAVMNGNVGPPNGITASGDSAATDSPATTFVPSQNPRQPIHSGETGAGIAHPAASGTSKSGLAGVHGLDVTFRIEINPSDREGHTQGYGFSVPALDSAASRGSESR